MTLSFSYTTQKRALQIAVGLGAIIPIAAGLAGIVRGPDMIDSVGFASLSLDSHFRYLSGLLLGIGVAFCTTIPDIQNKRERFELLAAIVFLGGLGRFYALIKYGEPEAGMLFGLVMELIVTPALAVAQRRLSHNWRRMLN